MLITIKNESERRFYEIECAKNARIGPDGKKELVEIATVAKNAIVQIEG